MLEILLAVGLMGAVLVLLATAIEMYLVRVDASRTRVESAQLARALLSRIANDLRAARYVGPTGDDASNSESDSANALGLFGTSTEIRIDRSAIVSWEQTTREPESIEESTQTAQMPQTVRYFLAEGELLASDQMAAVGVSDQSLGEGYAGLARQQVASTSNLQDAIATTATSAQENVELLAPEVLGITFSYFDGEQFFPEWDSQTSKKLPDGVEIRLTLSDGFPEDKNRPSSQNIAQRSAQETEYRLFVRLTPVRTMAASQPSRSSDQGNRSTLENNE